tara:strand:+ start:217 stop:834 length:618 start_codon:yes stop_codon:yes gene_type:complete
MFYEPKNGHTLRENPLNAIVIPRPIGWISTISISGIPNLAPYSFFNAVAYEPPQVMFASTGNHRDGRFKDAVVDAQTTGEFVINIATARLSKKMNATAVPAPPDIDEFEYAGLTKAPSSIVKCPRVAESPLHLECKYTYSHNILSKYDNKPNIVVFGEVVGIHIDDEVIVEGLIDVLKVNPIGRLGYLDFVEVNNKFSMKRPLWP